MKKYLSKILIIFVFMFSLLIITESCTTSKRQHKIVLQNLMLLDQKDLQINKQYKKTKITRQRERAVKKARRQAKRKRK